MLKEYDFSNARKNPYAKALKKQITINIDSNTIDYFKEQAEVVRAFCLQLSHKRCKKGCDVVQ